MLSSTKIESDKDANQMNTSINESAIEPSVIITVTKETEDKNTSAMTPNPFPVPSTQELNYGTSVDVADPPMIIKPYYQSRSNDHVAEAKIDELKGWLQKEFLSRMIRHEENKSNREELIPPQHHRKVKSMDNIEGDHILKKLIEDKFRQHLRERNSHHKQEVEQSQPPIIEESVSSEEPIIFFEPKPIELEHFVDETIADISTPMPTPVSSRISTPIAAIEEIDTLQQIIIDEDLSTSESKFTPLAQSSLEVSSLSSFITGHTPLNSSEIEVSLHDQLTARCSTPRSTFKS